MTRFEQIKDKLEPLNVVNYYAFKVHCDFCPCWKECKGMHGGTLKCRDYLLAWLNEEVT